MRMPRLVLGPVALGLLLAAPALAGDSSILYVDDDAPGGDGASWATACATLQDALVLAAALGEGVEIRVAGGTHQPDRGAGRSPGNRDETFLLPSGVVITGGWAGLAEKDPDDRDPAQWPTILSGDLLGDDAPGFKNFDENAFHVVTALATSETTTLDGLVIEGGHADGAPAEDATARDRGAAIMQWDGGLVLRDCVLAGHRAVSHGTIHARGMLRVEGGEIRDNEAIGFAVGIYAGICADVEATGVRFLRNVTEGNGAAVYADNGSTITCRDCAFEDNLGVRGSIFTAPASGVLVETCSFTANRMTRAGAGMFNDHSAPTIRGCVFTANDAWDAEGGGGIWNEGGAPTIEQCVFTNNLAFQGAGVYSIDAAPTIVDCLFADNEAQTGAGVWNNGGSPTVQGCVFIDNSATTGGGLYNEEGDALVIDCDFRGNSAVNGDGGGGIVNSFFSTPVIIGCTFTGNLADNDVFGGGGGVANYVSSSVLVDCLFVRNRSTSSGAAMYDEADAGQGPVIVVGCRYFGNVAADGAAVHNFRSDPVMTNCTFVGNRIEGEGTGRGGAIYNHFISSPVITNCTFAMNEAPDGPALRNADRSFPVLRNAIIWDEDEDEQPLVTGDPADIAWSLLRGAGVGPGMIDADPIFVRDPDAGPDGTWGTADDDYGDLRLDVGSPAIDAGHAWALPADARDLDDDGDLRELTPIDLDGAPRFADDPDAPNVGCAGPAPVDLGAYERPGDAVAAAYLGDLDGDGTVGFADLLGTLGAWGGCPDACCPGDFNGDALVGFDDLLVVLGAWGAGG